jgi:hypothetical protein
LIFKDGHVGTDVQYFMGVAAAGAGNLQFIHRLPDLFHGLFAMVRMAQLNCVKPQFIDHITRPVVMGPAAAG